MTGYEFASIIVSVVAIGVSVWSAAGKRKREREANDLRRAMSALAAKQHELILAAERGSNRARISLSLVREGKGQWFRVANTGGVEARNVEVKIVGVDGVSPIIASEYGRKFPAKQIGPGGSITLLAPRHTQSSAAYSGVLKWTNPDGSTVEETEYVGT